MAVQGVTTGTMFSYCNNLTTIYATNAFSSEKIGTSSNMFSNSTKIKGGSNTSYASSIRDKTYARIDCPIQDRAGYFTARNGAACTSTTTMSCDKYYSPATTSSGTTTFDSSWDLWICENTSTGEKEVCSKNSSGTVCLENNSNGRNNEWSCDRICDSGDAYGAICEVSGYTNTKKLEFQSNGFTCSLSCGVMDCTATSGNASCYMDDDGDVSCVNNNNKRCTISANGSSACTR